MAAAIRIGYKDLFDRNERADKLSRKKSQSLLMKFLATKKVIPLIVIRFRHSQFKSIRQF